MYSLETPSVTAKAYPGVNVVSWKPVTGASSYKVFVYEEGAQKGNARTVTTSNFITDTDLKNGKNYTYYVEAVSNSNPATMEREVYATNSRGEASVKAIVPPDNTKSLELPAYEDGYDGTNVKTVSESDQWVVKSTNIKAEVLNDEVYVSFPTKAYLKYQVKYYDNDLLPHDKNVNNGKLYSSTISDANANDVVGKVSFPITSAGTYQIAVVAKAYGSYADSDEVVREELVTIDALKLDTENNVATEEASVKYLYDDNKIANNTVVSGASDVARVSFKPAKKDGANVLTSWYKVYRRVDGEYANTLLAAVKEDVQRGVYYVDDKVPDITKTYQYTIVVTDGKSYGKAVVNGDSKDSKLKLKLSRPSEKTIKTIEIENPSTNKSEKEATWKVKCSDDALETGIKLTAYYWVKPADWNEKVLADDIIADNKTVELSLRENSSTERVAKTKVTGDVYLLVKAELSGYATTYVMKNATISYDD